MSVSHHVLDIWPHIDPRFGGVGPAAATLARAVHNQNGWVSDLLAVCDRNESERHQDIPDSVQIVIEQGRRPWADMRLSPILEKALLNVDICHVHGVWLP